MDAFQNVDRVVSKQISKVDGQADWQQWKDQDSKKKGKKNIKGSILVDEDSRNDELQNVYVDQAENDDQRELSSDANRQPSENSKRRRKGNQSENTQQVTTPNPFEQVQNAIALAMAAQHVQKARTESNTASVQQRSQWVASVDPLSRKTYYVNTTTHQTSWTKPDELLKIKTGEQSAPMLRDWFKTRDPGSGKVCYYDRLSGEISPTRPMQ